MVIFFSKLKTMILCCACILQLFAEDKMAACVVVTFVRSQHNICLGIDTSLWYYVLGKRKPTVQLALTQWRVTAAMY